MRRWLDKQYVTFAYWTNFWHKVDRIFWRYNQIVQKIHWWFKKKHTLADWRYLNYKYGHRRKK